MQHFEVTTRILIMMYTAVIVKYFVWVPKRILTLFYDFIRYDVKVDTN
jgi:hypothetical protein